MITYNIDGDTVLDWCEIGETSQPVEVHVVGYEFILVPKYMLQIVESEGCGCGEDCACKTQ